MLIEMTIKGLMVDPITNMPIVILKDKDGERVLPIWVGIFEANAIALQIENIATPRPMTHDLLRNIITDLDGQVDRVVVSDLKDNTFFAIIHLTVQGRARGRRRAAERRHRAGAADAGADPGGGDGHRQREDGRLRAPSAPTAIGCRSGSRASTRTTREVQDVGRLAGGSVAEQGRRPQNHEPRTGIQPTPQLPTTNRQMSAGRQLQVTSHKSPSQSQRDGGSRAG